MYVVHTEKSVLFFFFCTGWDLFVRMNHPSAKKWKKNKYNMYLWPEEAAGPDPCQWLACVQLPHVAACFKFMYFSISGKTSAEQFGTEK